ncbi:hypothetical protein dqs_0583 [Azoarcus olearius]|uniref:helix-turn-helix domain-containing protein n=1 Tax=Azoarcus sp. (strain BH72) TaxID=418699 RepID=UPI00080644BC|nr:hypothetical protein dqs_0583 [Azoarcus olearius]
MSKNTAVKKASQKDWHSADVVCALRKAGWSLARLAAHHGYASRSTLVHALHRKWPKGERLIAAAIGVEPETIWPSRYHADSTARSNVRSPRTAERSPERLAA